MNIGEAVKLRIIELCKQKGITVNKLATISGVTQSTLSNITSGRNNSTTISTIKKLCDGLDITVEEFFCSSLFKNLEQEIK
ncbi:MAG: helix-turn-helix transcriptional regulator [Ruminococcaceae bacterium]|nr:helix-turn-helix transcriptional regulator [Oscillospiraceae bacterium]